MRKREIKILSVGSLILCVVLTGCNLSAPTYGTGKTVSLQFFEDIANIASLTPKNNNSQIVMKDHPKLVEVKPGSHLVLPRPQQEVAKDNSLGKMTTRKQYHTHGKGGGLAQEESQVNKRSNAQSVSRLNEKQRQEYLRRQRAQVGSAKYRRYLTEPPLSYRQPAKIAPADKQGKEKR
ncbi:hypothetical protein [Bartonella rattaustraliani]|uniref:hypothetical protein n=1 Tax=Bartonella rattaustraliani TaxID=481139 RepID=UPI00031E8AA6|nr:hypothetical protein [Bartonella rattaustraliani]